MKIVLLNIYSPDTIARYLLSSYILKAYLKSHYSNDLTIEVLNFSTESNAVKVCDELIDIRADIIGYSCYTWNIEKVLKIIADVKCVTSEITQILGGPEISLSRISSLPDPYIADYYVIGEGERKLLRLITYIQDQNNGYDASFPEGVASWTESGINYSIDGNEIEELDEIPSVYLSRAIEDRLYARQQAFIETQRGCKFKCKYCVYHKNLQTLSYYSLERIYSELDYLIKEKKISALRFLDAVFTSNIERAKKIVRHLLQIKEKEHVRLPWIYWEFTYNSNDEEFFKLVSQLKYRSKIFNTDEITPNDRPQFYFDMLKDYTVINCVGFQSFSNQVLKAVSRPGITINKFDSFMNNARDYNVALKVDLILGLPYETFDTYIKGIEFFLPYFKNTDHVLNIHRCQILPGSDLENLCLKLGISYSKTAPHVVYSTNSMSEVELNYASKLSAVLFRILNSPLRRVFFEAKENSELSYSNIIEKIYNTICSEYEFRSTRIVQDVFVDDSYWYADIFREIQTQQLMRIFKTFDFAKY